MSAADEKLKILRSNLKSTGGIAVAFSGGLDSAFLAAVAQEELGEKALAVTALSPTYPAREQNDAAETAKKIGIRHISVDSNELEIDGFAENPADRCYFCKSELFSVVWEIAKREGLPGIADGSNIDDLSDYRPGSRAGDEQKILRPLIDAEMTKEDIRELSRKMNLPTAEKPAFACLASRFPYGKKITSEGLSSVDLMENALRDMGFVQVRVRHHGDVARIELLPEDILRATEEACRNKIVKVAEEAGFPYVALDLKGYRTGSMNEVLPNED
jgi:uncharacterized protein